MQAGSDRAGASADGAGGLLDRVASGAVRVIVVSRPRFWLYLAGPVLVGVVHGAPTLDAAFDPVPVALFAYFLFPANVLLYGVNDVFDAEIDAFNPKKAGDREARYRGDLLVPGATVVACLLGVAVAAVAPLATWPALGGFFALAVAYSAPPARFKTAPVLDSLSNGLYVLPGVAGYVAVAGHQPPLLAVAGGWLWTMGMHTFSAIPDVEPDRRAGITTTATWLGRRRSYAYCAAVWLAAAALFGALDPRAGVLLLVYPALVGAIRVGGVAVDRAYWWFPAVNTVVGALFTVAGLWELTHAA
ncbi:MAG: prenyltransferase [Halobacteriaceae archaeon]